MKIQLAAIHPEHISQKSNTTVVLGYMASNEVLSDYDSTVLVVSETQSGPELIILPHEGENISLRDPGFVDYFNAVLTSECWRRPNPGNDIAGEVAFVKAQAIDPNDGYHHHYLLLAVVSGEHNKLKDISGKLFQAELVENDMGYRSSALIDTGVVANHQVGSHFDQLFGQLIWGFQGEKVGLRYVNSLKAAQYNHQVIHDFIHEDKIPEDPAFSSIRNNLVYRDYLKAKEGIEPHAFVYWEDAPTRNARNGVPIKALIKSLIEDSPSP